MYFTFHRPFYSPLRNCISPQTKMSLFSNVFILFCGDEIAIFPSALIELPLQTKVLRALTMASPPLTITIPYFLNRYLTIPQKFRLSTGETGGFALLAETGGVA